jgi:hypothetical protein
VGDLLFVPQSILDAWSDQGKIELDGTTLMLPSEKRSFQLTPAVRFIKLEVGDEDPHKLLKKVKTADALKELGAEHMDRSVILGDVAYEVEPGFLADAAALKSAAAARATRAPGARPAAPAPAPAAAPAPPPPPAATAAPPAPRPPPAAPAPAKKEPQSEADVLADFMLGKIS